MDSAAPQQPAPHKLRDIPSRCCRLTRARIEPVSDWQFQFTDTPDAGFVAEILAVPSWSGELVELIAWRDNEPARWWLRDGEAMPLLGEDLIDLTQVRGETLELLASPAGWWAAIAAGREDVICVTNWEADPRFVMTGLRLRCSPHLTKRLRQWWAEHAGPTFKIVGDANAA